MQGTQNQTKSGSNSNMPFSKDSSNKDETSGLHDLQAMASSAKRRRSQRLSSQMDAQDSLLQSTAALDAVVLPDPNKEQVVAIADVAPIADKAKTSSALSGAGASVASVASAVPATELAESTKSSSGKGLYVAFALAAAAAVAAYVLFTNKSATPAEPAAKPVAAVVPVAVEPEAVEPEVVEPAVEPAANLDDSATDDSATNDSATDPVAKDSEEPSKPAVDVAKADKTPKSEKSSKSENKASETKAKTQTTKVAAVAKDKKPVKDSKPAETKVEKKPDANASLDDVLSSVTGGVDKPIAKETDKAAPSKTSLSRGDIAKAMGKVKGSAKACYKLEEFSGMVKVKYSVGSDGSVTKAAATGAHASSKTGACVAKAAKKAKFPPYSGAAMSSTYPFLLAP